MSGQTWQNRNVPQRVADSAAIRSATGSGSGTPTQQRQRHDESWIEVSSHPSSSSVSSIGDEIVTTGLQVGASYHNRRRRRLHPQHPQPQPNNAHQPQQQPTFVASQPSHAGASSSQEEYDESESEEDRVLTSSTEHVASSQAARSTPLRQVQAQTVESDSSDDDDDRRTALGRRPPEPFQPQPNAFSHPPSHLTHRHSTSSTMPQHQHRPSFGQRSQTRVERRTPNLMSPNYQADNDAALRASLTTLLSCAAAASRRKEDEKELGERPGGAASNRPVELRFAAESELMGPAAPAAQAPSRTNPTAATTASREGDKVKRAATPTGAAKSPRATKKKKTTLAGAAGDEALLSPTLLTWVVSAGVVVLVSVVGFGAGYVIGREVGRHEALGGGLNATAGSTSCGRDVIRGGGGTLRRFRWGSAVGRSVAA